MNEMLEGRIKALRNAKNITQDILSMVAEVLGVTVDIVVKPIPLKVRVLNPLPPARNKSCQPHNSRCNNKYKHKCINLFFPSQ